MPDSSFLLYFEQIAKHWSTNLVPEMTTEKLQALTSSCILSEEKEAILEIWNESRDIRLVHRFPVSPFNDAAFILYLHKYVVELRGVYFGKSRGVWLLLVMT